MAAMVRNMDKGARVWSLLTTRGWARRIVGGVLVLVLVVAATVWWLWPEGIPETTDAPPPSPLAESPPALPTEQLWSATSGTVAVAPGGYAVLVRQSVTVRDLFTGEIRWEYQHSEQSAIGISMLGADRMVIRFAVPDHKDARERAFHIPSGQRLDITETRQIIQATKPCCGRSRRSSASRRCSPIVAAPSWTMRSLPTRAPGWCCWTAASTPTW